MRRRFCCFLMALQMVTWVAATSRPFPPSDGLSVHPSGSDQSPESLQPISKESSKSEMEVANMKEVANNKGVRKIGSSPPSCKHKCYGCIPCEAIQVPTTSRHSHSHIGIQYANYEPEDWKCKCGPSFYTP